jgi:hypothetical protein
MHSRQEPTDIGIRRPCVADAQRGVRWSAGYIVAWPAADGRHPVGDDSQQELADAVGSVREVVARVLRDFGVDRLVAASPDSIHILGPAGLHEQSWSPTTSCRVTSVTRQRYRSH